MRAGVRLRAAVALLVAGALVLHAFMLSHAHGTASAPIPVADAHEASARSGHGHDGTAGEGGSDAAAIAGFCFSVLIGAALVSLVVTRPRALFIRGAEVDELVGGAGRRHRTTLVGVHDGPAWAVPVDAGVLLRV